MAQANRREVKAPRVLIVGTGAGVGTSTVIMGLLVALKRAGVSAAMAKVGPSLTDPTYHRRISGRLSHTIDFWMLSRQNIADSLARLSGGSELIVIEGEGGLHDQLDQDFAYWKMADFAVSMQIPVILVVDATGYGSSIAALVRGFTSFHPQLQIAGVIANRVVDARHNQVIRGAVESLQGPLYLGGVPVGDPDLIAGSHGAVSTGNPSLFTRNRLIAVGDLVHQSVNLNAIREIAARAGAFEVDAAVLEGATRRCRIAVADDAAFHLTVQDNLDLMRRAGAEIVAFSPLADLRLPPKTGGIYLPGGYVHLYATDLFANQAMVKSLRDFAQAGGVIYAEGGSIAYLCRKVSLYNGESYEMVGLLNGSATSLSEENVYVEPTYCEVTSREETILSRTGFQFRGLRDPRWLIRLERPVLNCYQMRERGRQDTTPILEGLSPNPNTLLSAVQAHWGSKPEMAGIFVDAVSASVPALQAAQASGKEG